MNDTPTRAPDASDASAETGSRLDAEVDGRTVRFWVLAGLAIAVVTLGVGAWWVWGLDRGMPMENGNAATGVSLGPFGFQPDVFPSAPGDEAYRPPRLVVLVTWADEGRARELRSSDEVLTAADNGEVVLEDSGTVVNMPMSTWPEGGR